MLDGPFASLLQAALSAAAGVLVAVPSNVAAQSTDITTEYLMTLHAPLDPPQIANRDLFIYNVQPGGWVKGPNIQGEFLAPSADWLRVMPNGTSKVDIRGSIKADDGSIIYITYTGRIVLTEHTLQKLAINDETLGPDDLYFMTSPTFETISEKYGWLNDVVAVGKMVSLKAGTDSSHVTYDIFLVR